ncbi:hypothetical protein J6590_073874 [Homalodisca vitripennis]|nr:hypothetical protein J6590_073874 [Homalodisca vitripennis]
MKVVGITRQPLVYPGLEVARVVTLRPAQEATRHIAPTLYSSTARWRKLFPVGLDGGNQSHLIYRRFSSESGVSIRGIKVGRFRELLSRRYLQGTSPLCSPT